MDRLNITILAYFKHLPIVQKRGCKVSLVYDLNRDHNTQGAAGECLDSSASQVPPEADNWMTENCK